jgi:LytS/YehU family sensor histidine kinase
LYIYGTLSGFKFISTLVNTSNLAPALAGLFAEPLAGISAGVIGTIHRYSLGGFTSVLCSLETIISVFIGGLIFMWGKGRLVGMSGAVLMAAANQILHSGLALLIAH